MVKKKLGGISKVTNYRLITIVCSLQIVDIGVDYVEQFTPRNYLQFSFVKGGGCEKACLCLRSIIDCFALRGSNVFIDAPDSSKVFDKVNHYGLLLKMINARVPLFAIRVIGNFYSKLSGHVCLLERRIF